MCVGGPERALSVRYAHGARILEQFALQTRSWIAKLHALWDRMRVGYDPLCGLVCMTCGFAVGRGEVRAILV